MVMMKKGGCDEIGGKKFLPPPSPELRYLLYFTYSLPTRSEEKEKFSLSEDILIENQYQCPNQ